jgi:MFS family permease
VTGAALLSIDRIGRRPRLLAGTGGVTLSLIVLGLAYLLPPQTALVNLILVAGLMVYIASFAASLDICIWLLNSEVYPLEIRGKGSATGSITHWVLALIIASTVLTLINTITETGTFWLYAACGIIGILFFRGLNRLGDGGRKVAVSTTLRALSARSGYAFACRHASP